MALIGAYYNRRSSRREEFKPWKDSTSFAEARLLLLKLETFLPHVICHDNIAPRMGEVALCREIMHSLFLSSSAGSAFSGHPSREGVTTTTAATIRAVDTV